jgi:hypothetical protein
MYLCALERWSHSPAVTIGIFAAQLINYGTKVCGCIHHTYVGEWSGVWTRVDLGLVVWQSCASNGRVLLRGGGGHRLRLALTNLASRTAS